MKWYFNNILIINWKNNLSLSSKPKPSHARTHTYRERHTHTPSPSFLPSLCESTNKPTTITKKLIVFSPPLLLLLLAFTHYQLALPFNSDSNSMSQATSLRRLTRLTYFDYVQLSIKILVNGGFGYGGEKIRKKKEPFSLSFFFSLLKSNPDLGLRSGGEASLATRRGN